MRKEAFYYYLLTIASDATHTAETSAALATLDEYPQPVDEAATHMLAQLGGFDPKQETRNLNHCKDSS